MTVTPEQLALINKYGSADLSPIEASELTAVTFRATNNLIGRNQGKWSTATLDQIAALLPGLSMTLDHEWGEIEDVQGVIFDARTVKVNSAPDKFTQVGGNGELNQQIIDDEGFVNVECDVAFYSTNSVLSMLRLGAIGKVSIGGFYGSSYLCPICECEFEDDNCPHYMPWDARDATSPAYAPYFLRDGIVDMGEISLVLIPNIPGAGIITRGEKIDE